MINVTFPETDEEVKYNRVRFLEELRKEAHAARAVQGTIFSRGKYVNGKPKCCALGIAAELYLGITNWEEYDRAENRAINSIYSSVDRMLRVRMAEIESVNDSISPPEFSFSRVADELERIWDL
jgi:hypothetical protein